MPTKPVHKTPAEMLADRAAALDAFQQANAARAAEIAERQRKAAEFAQLAADHNDAWQRGEVAPPERRNPLEVLNSAFQQRQAEHQIEGRQQRRVIEESPEHQRMVADLLMPLPSAHKAWVKAHINDGYEPSSAEAWSMLQDARAGLARAQKQYDAVAAQPWSDAEVAYAKQQFEAAQTAARAALDQFNELAGPVPVPAQGG